MYRFILVPTDDDTDMTLYDFNNPIYQVEEDYEEDYELPEELARLLSWEEKAIQPREESLEVINLGTEDVKKEVIIGDTLG